MAWYDDEYPVKKVVRESLPIGMRTSYRPGAGGFLERDLMAAQRERDRPAPREGIPIGGEQRRLEELEMAMPPAPITPPAPVTPPMPPQAIPTGDMAAPFGPGPGVVSDWRGKFDEAIAGITDTSPELKTIRMQAQGFGLPMGQAGRATRMAASKALVEVEKNRINALTALANTMAGLMMKPAEMQKDVWGKGLEHQLGERRHGLEERKQALQERLLPEQLSAIRDRGPGTVTGTGPRGEKILYGWSPERREWDVMSSGAPPVAVGTALVDPVSGEPIYKGEDVGKLSDKLSELAYREYMRELKTIDEDMLLEPEEQEERRQQAYAKLQKQFEKFGRSKLVGDAGQGARPKRPTVAQLKAVATEQGITATDEEWEEYIRQTYGE